MQCFRRKDRWMSKDFIETFYCHDKAVCPVQKSLVKVVCFILYVCSWINSPILIPCFLFFNVFTTLGVRVTVFLKADTELLVHITKHTLTQVSMDAHSPSDTCTIADLLIVTQETDTFSGREELSGEFVKQVLNERLWVLREKTKKVAKFISLFFIFNIN